MFFTIRWDGNLKNWNLSDSRFNLRCPQKASNSPKFPPKMQKCSLNYCKMCCLLAFLWMGGDLVTHTGDLEIQQTSSYLGDSQVIQESCLRCIFRYRNWVALFYICVSSSISQFLNDNFDYDEVTALEQLSAYGLKSLMFDVAKVNINAKQ